MKNKNKKKYGLETLDDHQLVRNYNESGDVSILNILLERWSTIAMGTAMQVMMNKCDAEDMVQEAYIKIIKNLKNFEGDYGIVAWVRKIVYNTCMSKKVEESKRKNREIKFSTNMEESSKGEAMEEKNIEIFELIKSKWDGLPQHYRLPVWLRHYERMEFKEIANLLSLSESTVKSQAKRGLEKLKGLLSKSGITLTTVLLTNTFMHMESKASAELIVSKIPGIIKDSTSTQLTKVILSMGTVKFVCLFVFLGSLAVFIFDNQLLRELEREFFNGDVSIEKVEPFSTWSENFNDAEISDHIVINVGKVELMKDGGVNNSSCLKIVEDVTILKLKFPHAKLPLKLSYKSSFATNSRHGIIIFWSSFEWLCQLNGWGDMNVIVALKDNNEVVWSIDEVYLTESAIISMSGGKRISLNIFNKAQRNDFKILFYGGHLIDDLKLEQIKKTDVPDIATELKALDSIRAKKQKGSKGIVLDSKLIGNKNQKVNFQFLNNKHVNGENVTLNTTGK